MSNDDVFYFESPQHHGGHHVLSFSFCFDREQDVYQFALTFPYSYTRSQAFLQDLEDKNLPCCKRKNICYSVVSIFDVKEYSAKLHNYSIIFFWN